MKNLQVPAGGFHTDKQVPSKVHRRQLSRTVHKLRSCRDGRAYVAVPFTILGVVATGNYGPEWAVDRDYWVARLTVDVGRHDSASHPNDGTPSGLSMLMNMRRVSKDLSSDVGILANDARLNVAANHHRDAVNDDEDGGYAEGDFTVHRLNEGQHIYPRITRVGSGRPGTNLVITAVLVPIP